MSDTIWRRPHQGEPAEISFRPHRSDDTVEMQPASNVDSGIFRQLYRQLPANARLLLESALGVKRPIGNADFSAKDLQEISTRISEWQRRNIHRFEALSKDKEERVPNEVVSLAKSLGLNVADDTLETLYNRYGNPNRVVSNYTWSKDSPMAVDKATVFDAIRRSFTDPAFRVDTSLGRFVAHSDNDNWRLDDKYGWTGDDINWEEKGWKDLVKHPTLGLNYLAEKFFPRVQRDVNVTVPKQPINW